MEEPELMDALCGNAEGDDIRETGDGVRTEAETSAVLALQQKKIARLDEEIKDLQQDREQRRKLSYWLFGFMCAYMAFALLAVFLTGFGLMGTSDKVQITLLTTALADVVGVFSFVAKYLYHNKT